MKQNKAILILALLMATLCSISIAKAQSAHPTAIQPLQLTAFVGGSADYTGLEGGKNVSLTAGADLAFSPFHSLRPALEVRGFIPIDKGTISSQKAVLGGLRLDFLLGHRFHPYGDILIGRGQIDYAGTNGLEYNGLGYRMTNSNIFSGGGGLDYDITDHFAVKIDAQIQRWGSIPTASGTINPKIGTIGVVYRFGRRDIP